MVRPVSQGDSTAEKILGMQKTIGNQAVQHMASTCPSFPSACPTGGACHTCPARIQPKLTVGKPGDKYEQEADRVADTVMRMPQPRWKEDRPLQRSCLDCGEELHRQPLEEEEEEEELVQAKEAAGRSAEEVPGVQTEINGQRCGGQPLPQSTRSFLEPRFGYDFSRVRIHNDSRAAAVARTVNAQAFTMGRDIVFGAAQYAPGTSAGRKLLTHELTHILQQRNDSLIQRQMASIAGQKNEQGPYIPGKMSLLYHGLASAERAKVSEEVDRIFRMETGIVRKLDWKDPKDRPLARKWLRIRDEVMAKHLKGGEKGADPSEGLREVGPEPKGRGEKVKIKQKPSPVCGPDVTSQIIKALSELKSKFRAWSPKKQRIHCNALVIPPKAAFAWDIIQLHRNAWILWYRYSPPCPTCKVGTTLPPNPVCAVWGANPPCGSTVQVGNECYYAGSVNYVVFGVMCKLCLDYLRRYPNKRFFAGTEFSESEMLFLINLYKFWGLAGANLAAAKAWASAGYHGWPSGGSPPSGDRSNCTPACPSAYQYSEGREGGLIRDFEVTWCPSLKPWRECISYTEALKSVAKAIFSR